jgi:virulence factor Mce-like protein
MQSLNFLRSPIAWGTATLALLAVVAVVAAMVYVSPPGQKYVTFYTDDAASVAAGDQVRVAGIAVGEVKDLSLEPDRVRVRARVDDDVFVGNKSQVEVRMLTVVGGYYVDLISLGDAPLDDKTIPQERVTMPYSLIRTLNDATKISDNLAAKPINQSLNEIQAGMQGDNIETLNAVIEAGNTVMSTIDKQRGQITSILDLSDEYIAKLAEYRGELTALIQKIAIIQSVLEIYSKGFGSALDGLGKAVQALKTVGNFYEGHQQEFLEKVHNFLTKGRVWINRNGLIVRGLRDIQNHIERIIDVQQAPPEMLATDLCFPMPGSPCQ